MLSPHGSENEQDRQKEQREPSEEESPPPLLSPLPTEVKNFYSAGASFSILGGAGVVRIVWAVLEGINPFFKSAFVGLFIAALLVYAYAKVIPEARGYLNAGERKITRAEWIFGAFNSILIFAVVLGWKCIT